LPCSACVGPMALLLSMLLTTSCTYQIKLIPREQGQLATYYIVRIDSFSEVFSGQIDLVADGISYSGTYVVTSSDYGLTLLRDHGPTHGNLVKEEFFRYGQAKLRSGSRTLRCEYIGTWTSGGFGVCVSNEGKIYDMLIFP